MPLLGVRKLELSLYTHGPLLCTMIFQLSVCYALLSNFDNLVGPANLGG